MEKEKSVHVHNTRTLHHVILRYLWECGAHIFTEHQDPFDRRSRADKSLPMDISAKGDTLWDAYPRLGGEREEENDDALGRVVRGEEARDSLVDTSSRASTLHFRLEVGTHCDTHRRIQPWGPPLETIVRARMHIHVVHANLSVKFFKHKVSMPGWNGAK